MEMAVPITVAKLIVPPKARGCASETAVGAGLEIPIEVQVGLPKPARNSAQRFSSTSLR
jgi:hypothetical protein